MRKPPPQPPEYGENIAGRLFEVVRQLNKNREQSAGIKKPTPLDPKVSRGQEVMNALLDNKENEQEQNATPASGVLQKKEAKKEDGSEMSDKEKRKAALEKAKKYKEQKKNRKGKDEKEDEDDE